MYFNQKSAFILENNFAGIMIFSRNYLNILFV